MSDNWNAINRQNELEGALAIVTTFRRPQITDYTSFYYITEANWNTLIRDAKSENKSKVKVALNNLRKCDSAGRIMETDEGMDAPNFCSVCKKDSRNPTCRVWRNNEDLACALCKRLARAGCKANTTIEETDEEEDDSPDAGEGRVAELEAEMERLKAASSASEQRVKALEDAFEKMQELLLEQKSINDSIRRIFMPQIENGQ